MKLNQLYVEMQDLIGEIIGKQILVITNGVVSFQNMLVEGVYLLIGETGSDNFIKKITVQKN